jgi:two-component system sensor histidine kinase YesM
MGGGALQKGQVIRRQAGGMTGTQRVEASRVLFFVQILFPQLLNSMIILFVIVPPCIGRSVTGGIFMKYARLLFNNIRNFANKSISNRIILFFVPLTTALIITVGVLSFFNYYSKMERQIINDTMKIIEQVNNNVDFYFNDIKTPMAMIAMNTNVVKMLTNYENMDYTQRLLAERDIEDFTNNINSFKSYIGDLIIVGRNDFRKNLKPKSQLLYSYNFLKAPWFQDIIRKNQKGVQFISLHVCDYYPTSGLPYNRIVSAVLPVYGQEKVLGYIICDINMNKLKNLSNSFERSKDGIIYMVDQQGKIIFHPEEAMLEKQMDSGIKNRVLSKESGNLVYQYKGGTDLVIFSRSSVTGWTLVAQIPYSNIYSPVMETRTMIYWIIGISIICIILISIIIANQIRKPLDALVHNMQTIEQQDFKPVSSNYGYGETAILGERFESMAARIDMLIKDVYLSKVKQREAELDILRNQINPHFLYNALQLVKAEAVFSGNKEISSIVTSLGYLLRYTMNNKKEMVKIVEEVEYARYYLEIYQRRYEDKFAFFIYLPRELEDCLMPKLILQPIIENSLRHGLEKVKTGGIIDIRIYGEENDICFEVFDNGEGIEAAELEQLLRDLSEDTERNIGLHNIHQRLLLKFGENAGIRIESEAGKHTRVWFRIPRAPAKEEAV